MSLKHKALTSTKWSAIENWVSQVLSLAVFLIIARLLQPEAFGLVALASVFIITLTTLTSLGLSQAVVQREEIETEHLDTAFWSSLIVALGLAGCLVLLSPLLSELFSQPDLEYVLNWLSVGVILHGLINIHTGILRREFKFKSLALRTIVGLIVGGVVGIGMAINGYGVWALVAQQLTSATIGVVIIWLSVSWNPRLTFSKKHLKDLFSFSSSIMGISLLGLVNRRLDDFLIGSYLGATALGIYSIAYKVFTVMTTLLVETLSKVALPTFSRMQSDLPRMQNAYYSAVQITSVICVPIFSGVLITAPDLIPTLFGPQWEQSAPVTQYLMVVGLLYCIAYFNAPFLMALGKPGVVLKLNILNSTLNAVAFFIAVRWGIVAVAMAFMIRALLVFPIGLYIINKYAGITPKKLLVSIKGPTFSVIAMVMALLTVNAELSDQSTLMRLLLEITCGATVYLLTLYLTDRPIFSRVIHLIEVARNKNAT